MTVNPLFPKCASGHHASRADRQSNRMEMDRAAGATRTRSGTSHSMKSAVLDAQRKIDKELVSVKVKQAGVRHG